STRPSRSLTKQIHERRARDEHELRLRKLNGRALVRQCMTNPAVVTCVDVELGERPAQRRVQTTALLYDIDGLTQCRLFVPDSRATGSFHCADRLRDR